MGTFTGTNNSETLTGTAGDDTLSGLGGNDTLDGGAGHDILIGGAGSDILIGGVDADIYRDTAANFNGDEITNFKIGDRIDITDLNIGNGGQIGLTGNLVTYTNGNDGTSGVITIDDIGSGRLVLRPTGSGQELRLQQDAHNDFNGDGRSDVLWRNDDGTMRDWLAQSNGSFVGNIAHFDVNPGLDWHVAGTGDFNGDGRVDILWRNDDGTMRDWIAQSDGSFVGNIAHFNVNPGLDWHVKGTGDFNGDGRSDVLWQNDSGLVTEWLGQPDGSLVGHPLNVNPGLDWHAVGTGDFNGDGYSDVLWQNDSGLVTEWLGQSDGRLVGHPLNVNPGTDWHVVGVGDFNADARDDILWRNDAGTMRDWIAQPDGTFVGNVAHFDANPGADWHVVGIGDYNGNAGDDLLLRNTSGQMSEWVSQIDGSFAVNASITVPNPGGVWHTQDPFVHDPFA